MATIRIGDPGRSFEQRAITIARAIHDPSALQGSVMFRGREHDGLFVDEQSITAYEFTTERTKAKAIKDGEKLRDVLAHFRYSPGSEHKVLAGYFVTEEEPTAIQRAEVDRIAKASNLQIIAISFAVLRKRLIDAESYIQLRRSAPFGSTTYDPNGRLPYGQKYIEQSIQTSDGGLTTITGLANLLVAGEKIVVTADYGAGKSTALQRIFEILRSRYFRNPSELPIPVHINLRDVHGLRTPSEVLRRHAEDVGYRSPEALIATWRSGNVALLLDGFDELIPTRWAGSPRDLRSVRKQALTPVRRLIEETPPGVGLVIAGRPQYFANLSEIEEALSLRDARFTTLRDFDEQQIREYIDGKHATIPQWVPSRPLLLNFIFNELDADLAQIEEPNVAWLYLLRRVAEREARNVTSVTSENVELLLSRIATLARAQSGPTEPISLSEMRRAYVDVCNYEPDEEGLQLLLRMPGLYSSASDAEGEMRQFIDADLADAAYGRDLGQYMSNPYGNDHPLSKRTAWTTTARPIASGVAAAFLGSVGFETSHAISVVRRRLESGLYDATLFDATLAADVMGASPGATPNPHFHDLMIEVVELSGDSDLISCSLFSSCMIDVLDVSSAWSDTTFPTFRECIIGRIEGWQQVPDKWVANFVDTEIVGLSGHLETTDGLLSAGRSLRDSIALTILDKVYMQAGRARKMSALSRGIPMHDRGEVDGVIEDLMSMGLLTSFSGHNERFITGVRGMKAEVAKILAEPAMFSMTKAR